MTFLEHGPLFEAILGGSREGVAAARNDRLITANPRFRDLFGIGPRLIQLGEIGAIIDHVAARLEDGDRWRATLLDAVSVPDRIGELAAVARTRDGRLIEWTTSPLIIYGQTHGWVWTAMDVTARERAAKEAQALAAELDHAHALAGLAAWEIDADTLEFTWSEDAGELLGISTRAGQAWDDASVRWVGEGTEASIRARVQRALQDGTPLLLEESVHLPDGSQRALRAWARPVRDQSGRILKLVGTVQDVSAPLATTAATSGDLGQPLAPAAAAPVAATIIAAGPALTHGDNRVALTPLTTSADFERELEKRLLAHEPFAVLVVDLDRFANVNAAFGHAVGDRALIAYALRLQRAVADAVLARIGGEEFGVLVDGAGEQASELADDLRAALSAPLDVDGRTIVQHASIGIATPGPRTTTGGRLLHEARTAARLALEHGGNQTVAVDPSIREIARQELALEPHLRAALAEDALELVFQPIVDLRTRSITALEAQLHWEPPGQGPIDSQTVHTVAEHAGLAGDVGTWVLRAATRQIARWRAIGVPAPCIAVDVSDIQLARPGFVEDFTRLLAEHDVPAHALILELTEPEIMRLPARAHGVVEALRTLGSSLVLDGFGGGAASLARLKQIPVSGLKLDASFTAGLPKDRPAAAIVEAVVSLGRSLGLRVAAAGIDTVAQLHGVRDLGCAYGQGALFGGPVATHEVPALLRQRLAIPVAGDEPTLSAGSAAATLGISVSTLRRWTNEGRLVAVRTAGGHRRFLRSDIERALATARPRVTTRVPEIPTAPLETIGALVRDRAEWLADITLSSVYLGEDRGWFSTPAGADELLAWISALGRGMTLGDRESISAATRELRRVSLAASVPLVELAAVVDGAVSAAQAAVAPQRAELQEELRTLRRLARAVRWIVLDD